MKTENKRNEKYVTPEMTQIDIVPEGVLCASDNIEDPGLGDEL